ncbi:DUF1254 domain-containing protein [Thalassotalea psychrophila]|uniref:DUF1254 domain-containing protein n=1 Tax=Thalassotalea psychrophila TaxID=3065647 RepID=A0ABY9TY72_9GAMM|nr:DUF1254 domain-containing protein [Colwelliaceae bacterium SQ149]
MSKPVNPLINIILAISIFVIGSTNSMAKEQPISERMMLSRAVESVVWAMPLLNYKEYRDGHVALGVKMNDIAYNSKVQDWKYQTATPNNTTPYVSFFWNVENGPMVVEIPPSADGVGIFGTLMDAWQRPIDDVGAAGRDKGNGGKYILLPKGYDGPLLSMSYSYEQRTNNGFAILRPIMQGGPTAENLKKAADFAKQIKIYPLAEASKPPKNNYVDIYGKILEATPILDGTIYNDLNEILQEEIVEEQNLAMYGLLNNIGIRKGQAFNPDAKMQSVYDEAGPDALEFLIDQYHRQGINSWMYPDKKWSTIVPPGVVETDFTYEYPTHFDYNARGATYYAIISSVKNFGSATFYLDIAETADNEWLDGTKNYKLVVPPNVPAKDFWAITVYDLESASYLRDMPKSSVDSNMDMKKNKDGSTTVYFGPKAPKGKEANWLPTNDKRFFLLFRFYGPTKGLRDGSFELNNIELVK